MTVITAAAIPTIMQGQLKTFGLVPKIFPVKIDTGGQNINIVDQSVTEVTLKFETSYVAQVKVNVNFEGKVAEGYIRNDPVCVPSVINIEGPESKVNAIEAAEVTISEKEFSETQVYNCEYEFVDANGNTIDKAFVKTDVDAVQVSVAVMKTKTIPVTATLVNSSGGNENSYATLTIEPSTINIERFEKGLLRQLLGLILAMGEPQREAVHPGEIASKQGLKILHGFTSTA